MYMNNSERKIRPAAQYYYLYTANPRNIHGRPIIKDG